MFCVVSVVTLCFVYCSKRPPPNTLADSASRTLHRMSHSSSINLHERTILIVLNVRCSAEPFKAVELCLFIRIDQIIQHCCYYIILLDSFYFCTLRSDHQSVDKGMRTSV